LFYPLVDCRDLLLVASQDYISRYINQYQGLALLVGGLIFVVDVVIVLRLVLQSQLDQGKRNEWLSAPISNPKTCSDPQSLTNQLSQVGALPVNCQLHCNDFDRSFPVPYLLNQQELGFVQGLRAQFLPIDPHFSPSDHWPCKRLAWVLLVPTVKQWVGHPHYFEIGSVHPQGFAPGSIGSSKLPSTPFLDQVC